MSEKRLKVGEIALNQPALWDRRIPLRYSDVLRAALTQTVRSALSGVYDDSQRLLIFEDSIGLEAVEVASCCELEEFLCNRFQIHFNHINPTIGLTKKLWTVRRDIIPLLVDPLFRRFCIYFHAHGLTFSQGHPQSVSLELERSNARALEVREIFRTYFPDGLTFEKNPAEATLEPSISPGELEQRIEEAKLQMARQLVTELACAKIDTTVSRETAAQHLRNADRLNQMLLQWCVRSDAKEGNK